MISPSTNTSIPRVSVLMAVFNTEAYLREALESVRNQTFTDFELVVVDDGSTDGSDDVLRAFALDEPRMRLITRGNKGLIATRNELLRAAHGNLIAWMDSDDISTPDRLALQVARFDQERELVCLGGVAQCIDPAGEHLNVEQYPLAHTEILMEQQRGGAMRFPTTMMRRDAALRTGGFREPFRIGEDFDLLLRMSEAGRMANLPNTIYFYRQHLSSVCATLGPQWLEYRDQILALAQERKDMGSDKLQRGETVTISRTPPANINHLESRIYVRWSKAAKSNKNMALARRYALAAIRKHPQDRSAWKNLIKMYLPI